MDFIEEYVNYQQNIAKLIKEGKLIVESIPLYENLKFNLNGLMKKYLDMRWINETYYEGIICQLSAYLYSSKSTFLAPAYFLNSYIDILTEYTMKYLKGETNSEDNMLFKSKSTINIQNIFISMKCLLDRLVPIISYYYKGISLTSTFGRINENGKASGLIGRVVQDKERDRLFEYIYDQYDKWIKYIVAPRDIVMHYNDMDFRTQPTVDGRIIIFHIENKIFDKEKHNEDLYDGPIEHYYKSISKDVKRLYKFYETIFSFLKSKKVIYTKHHFKDDISYKKYIDMSKETNNLENKIVVRCKFCGKKPEEISEYICLAEEEKITPTQYVIENDNTYNKATGEFLCTECYVQEHLNGNIR